MARTDATGKNAGQRYAEVRRYFLEMLGLSGHIRTELYYRPRTGPHKGLPTEQQLVRGWAESLEIPVNDICIGIQRAFQQAQANGQVVSSFAYCVPQIVARVGELREARVGMGPVARRENES